MIKTYLDANILIAGFRSDTPDSQPADNLARSVTGIN